MALRRVQIADAMYAPVVLRFNTYGAGSISPAARWYMATVLEDAPLQEWLQLPPAGNLDLPARARWALASRRTAKNREPLPS